MMLEQSHQLSLPPVPVLVEYPPTFATRGYRGAVPGFTDGTVGVWRAGRSEKWLSAEVCYDTFVTSLLKSSQSL